jgi:NAD(P)-dependent dehydrogenase (short-subunit alcohol dehydrogenase family)
MPNPLDRFRLDGRTALVTGARREIGAAIAQGLAAAGARLAIHHAGTDEETKDAAATVQRCGNRAQAFAADFSQKGAAETLAAEVTAAFGQVDILVLNASIEILEPVGAITRAAYDRQMEINVWSTLALLQALVPPMGERGWGRVVTIGSVQQISPAAEMLVYAGYKALQHNWAINLARQFTGRGVTVNNLAPGLIATARNADQIAARGEQMKARIPAGRMGRPGDLVGAALLLCSDAGEYISGANLYVDGGRSVNL